MKWKDVFQKHRKVNAVYTEGGELQSLIFSNDPRRNRINQTKGKILYFYLRPEHSDNDLNALKNAIKNEKSVPVYRKVSPDNWVDLGPHRVKKFFYADDSLGRPSTVFVVSPT